jgi:predicted metal-binding membrane protein
MSASDTSSPPLLAEVAPFRRALFWIAFYLVVLLAWFLLFTTSLTEPMRSLPGVSATDFWFSLCSTSLPVNPLALYGMWVLMTMATLLPTFVPALRVFGEIADVNASSTQSVVALTAGYAAAWLAFSVAGALLQLLLSSCRIVAPDGTSLSSWFSAMILFAAGAYQLLLVKRACLARCRQPLVFFLQYWRPGNLAAFAIGFRLGVRCVGCCWVLMALSVVGGAMNPLWMGASTLFMTFEKLPDVGGYLTKPAAAILLAASGVALAHAIRLI